MVLQLREMGLEGKLPDHRRDTVEVCPRLSTGGGSTSRDTLSDVREGRGGLNASGMALENMRTIALCCIDTTQEQLKPLGRSCVEARLRAHNMGIGDAHTVHS
jgi:hypothetical protein